jgi:DNA-binding NtrC family response regulator
MDSLTEVRTLHAAGRFADALRLMSDWRMPPAERQVADVLRMDLLEHTGRVGQARALAQNLLKSRSLSDRSRSVCDFVLARVEREDGSLQSSISHLQRAIASAAKAQDFEHCCWLRLRLFRVLVEVSGPEAASALLTEIRNDIRKLGNPQLTAALHIFFGEMETKRGSLKSGEWHTQIGLQLLSNAPNLWLETDAEITNVAIAILRCDSEAGLAHAARALQLADESGRAAARRAALANFGNLLYTAGRVDEAIDYYKRAIEALPSDGDNCHAVLDAVARVELARGRLDRSAALLERISAAAPTGSNRRPYAYRHALLTRTQLLARQGHFHDALASVESVLQLASEAHDHLLHQVGLITKADLQRQLGRTRESFATLDLVVSSLTQQPPDLYADYERVIACALAATGESEAAIHFDRAKRMYESIQNLAGLSELARSFSESAGGATTVDGHGARRAPHAVAVARDVVQTIALLLRHHNRAPLIAKELVYLLSNADCVLQAQAVTVDVDGKVAVLATYDAGNPGAADGIDRRLTVGAAGERSVELILKLRSDIESQATLNASRLLLATVQDLERARAEREERLSLWPADDEPFEATHAVVNGKMRPLMISARRIANTNVSVLITGESGTGKEILARAIHNSSDRAARPFIAFNCTAVPRDMLESQLFGHRRGAFTGAEHDHPGMVGAARNGTLFLDEIGELDLELQPKLLRFLESSEICPVGESRPYTVDVRVIAATNSNIEQLVAERRFREDLFYRLNAFRFRVEPLRDRRDEIPALVSHFVRRFADEFKKGHISVAEATMEHLLLCRWPGNVRQLQNEIRRMVALAEPGSVLTPDDLSDEVFNTRLASHPAPSQFDMVVALRGRLAPTIEKVEREMIRLALHDHRGRVDETARALGVSRKGLYLKRQRLGL